MKTVPEDEEYAVLSVVAQSAVGENAKMLVITDHEPRVYLAAMLSGFGQKMEIPQAVIDDYTARNKQTGPFEKRFKVSVEYVFISDAQCDEIFRVCEYDGWDDFDQKYPNSAGIIHLSRPGFNSDRTVALVYMGQYCGPLCGSGDYYLLEKKDGVWTITGKQEMWVS